MIDSAFVSRHLLISSPRCLLCQVTLTTRSSLFLPSTCRLCPSRHSLHPPQQLQFSVACAVMTAAGTARWVLYALLSCYTGHISRLQLVLNELRVPWKEYLRQKKEEEERSAEFKRQADGAPPHAAFCVFAADQRVQLLQFSCAPTARISPARP